MHDGFGQRYKTVRRQFSALEWVRAMDIGLDWWDKSSPWRFITSDYGKNAGVSKCELPFSISKGKASFGGKV